MSALFPQIAKAAGYYAGLLVLVRFSGKRLAGQTTTFDLIVLITLGVVLQEITLEKGATNALVFIVTVLALHRFVAFLCARFVSVRHLLRGKPRELVRDGKILKEALAAEGLCEEELVAGLRKLGFENASAVKRAHLEETGHISAIGTS